MQLHLLYRCKLTLSSISNTIISNFYILVHLNRDFGAQLLACQQNAIQYGVITIRLILLLGFLPHVEPSLEIESNKSGKQQEEPSRYYESSLRSRVPRDSEWETNNDWNIIVAVNKR